MQILLQASAGIPYFDSTEQARAFKMLVSPLMATLVISSFLALGSGLALILRCLHTAPEGWQDEHGFHSLSSGAPESKCKEPGRFVPLASPQKQQPPLPGHFAVR